MSALGGKADINGRQSHEHRWLSAQRQEPEDEAFESLKDDVSLAAASDGADCSD
jgi:hypothetical protein